MAIAVDDEIEPGSTAPPASLPTNKPVGRPKVEIVEDSGNNEQWTEVGKLIIPGQSVNENQPNVESSTGNNEIEQPSVGRPRSPRHRRPSSNGPASVKADVAVEADNMASPAIAPKSMLSQRSPGEQQNVQTTEPKEPTESPAQASSMGEPPVTSNNAQSGVADKATSSGSNKNEPTKSSASNKPLTDDTASPAYVGEKELVQGEEAQNLAGRGKGEQTEKSGEASGKEEPKKGGEGEEQKDQTSPATEDIKNNSGPLQGVAGAGEENFDSFSAAKKPTESAAPTAAPGAESGEQGAGIRTDKGKKGNTPDDDSKPPPWEEDTVVGRARALREGKVIKQKEDQQQSIARVAELVKGMKLNSAAVVAQAQGLSEQAYKQAWQFAQEAVEDLSLVPLMIFISGPILIALYVIRWMFGNMMGGLFKIQVSIPSIPGMANDGPSKISIQMVPSYSLGDIQDHERHFKMLIIGGITIIIYGFIIMLLYYYTHWWEALIAAVKGGWGLIINLLPAYKP